MVIKDLKVLHCFWITVDIDICVKKVVNNSMQNK